MIFIRKNNVELEYQTSTQFTTLSADNPSFDEYNQSNEDDEDDDLSYEDDDIQASNASEQEYLWYVIDLTNKKLFGVKDNHERAELEWHSDVDLFIEEAKPDCIHTLNLRIENNRNVIYTSTQRNDLKELEKAKLHMERNYMLIDFIKSYGQ